MLKEEKPKQCESERDYRGTLWKDTLPGIVVSKPCLKGFNGMYIFMDLFMSETLIIKKVKRGTDKVAI